MVSLAERVAARGFPSAVIAGDTGAGALASQGTTADPAHGDTSLGTPGYTTQVLAGQQPDTPAPPNAPILDGYFGLPGTAVYNAGPGYDPDAMGGMGQYSHAAPVAGFAGSPEFIPPGTSAGAEMAALGAEIAEIHSQGFGQAQRNEYNPESARNPATAWYSNDPGSSNQQPVQGQLQNMGGYDAVQGYGGGSDGPGGINDYGLGAPHVQYFRFSQPQPQPYLDPSETAFLAPQGSGSFVPSDAVQSQPWGSFLDAPSAIYTDPTAYEPPPDPSLAAAPDTGGPVSSGWW